MSKSLTVLDGVSNGLFIKLAESVILSKIMQVVLPSWFSFRKLMTAWAD